MFKRRKKFYFVMPNRCTSVDNSFWYQCEKPANHNGQHMQRDVYSDWYWDDEDGTYGKYEEK